MGAYCQNTKVEEDEEDAENYYDDWQVRVGEFLLLLLHQALKHIEDKDYVGQVQQIQPVECDSIQHVGDTNHHGENKDQEYTVVLSQQPDESCLCCFLFLVNHHLH